MMDIAPRERISLYLHEHLNDTVNGRRMAAIVMAWTAGYREEQTSDGSMRYIPTGEHSEQLAEMAKSDGAAWDACLMLASGCIDRGEPVPAPLRGAVIAALRKKATGPAGKTVWGNLHRDLVLCMAISMYEDAGIPATRNDASETQSGCDLVAVEAANILAREISYDTLKKIWLHNRRHVHEVKKYGPFYFQRRPLLLRLQKR